jgi:hypothetical protein
MELIWYCVPLTLFHIKLAPSTSVRTGFGPIASAVSFFIPLTLNGSGYIPSTSVHTGF